MNPTLVDSPPWTRRRWGVLLLLIFTAQFGLLCWLADNRPIRPRAPAPAPVLQLVTHSTEPLALNDPTLFALPHRESFAGLAWLNVAPRRFPPPNWTEDARWLNLAENQLGAAFNRLIEPNLPYAAPAPALPEPALDLPATAPLSPWRERSTLRIEGDLARRPLRTAIPLPAWRHVDLLTNSIVQLVVLPGGQPLSVSLLSGSGYQPADDFALEQAKAARFASLGETPEILDQPGAHLSWGQLVFEWLTQPVTNQPAATQ